MSDRDVIESKMSYLRKRLATARKYRTFKLQQIQQEGIVRGAVERELYLICQSAIDLAEALIAFRRYRKPNTMREGFEILKEEGVLPSKFADEFSKITGFRNAMAHGYENLDPRVVYDVLQNKTKDVEKYLAFIQKTLDA
jgi:uncharacterized protein YutE (UPF0331/DUF86 family)